MKTKTIDMTPSPIAYKRMLEFIAENNTDTSSVEWAREELVRIQPNGTLVTEWSKKDTG